MNAAPSPRCGPNCCRVCSHERRARLFGCCAAFGLSGLRFAGLALGLCGLAGVCAFAQPVCPAIRRAAGRFGRVALAQPQHRRGGGPVAGALGRSALLPFVAGRVGGGCVAGAGRRAGFCGLVFSARGGFVAHGLAGMGGLRAHAQSPGLQRAGHPAPGLGSAAGRRGHCAKPLGRVARRLCPGGRVAGVSFARIVGLGADHCFAGAHAGAGLVRLAAGGSQRLGTRWGCASRP